MCWEGQIRLLNVSYFKIVVFGLLQLTKFYAGKEGEGMFSQFYFYGYLLAFCLIVFAGLYPWLVYRFLHKRKFKTKMKQEPVKFRQKWGALFEIYKDDGLKAKNFETIVLVKKFL